MNVSSEYKPPVQEEPSKKTLFSFILSVLSFVLLPFKFAKEKLQLVKEDTAKKRKFLAWRKVQNARYRRGNRLNDEF